MYSFEATNVSKKFGEVEALKNASIKFEGNKICGLIGANGSGKTTFSKICSGLIKADNGEFIIDGKKVVLNSPLDAKQHGIILIHQNLSLVPELTVSENICLGQENRIGKIFNDDEFNKKTASEILSELTSEINICEKVVNLGPAQKQIVEVAKALYRKPQLLILDEPTAPLEYFHVEKLLSKIKQLKNEKILVIFISHRLWEVTKICDLVFAFRDGETVGSIDFSKKARDQKYIVPLVTGQEYKEKDNNKKTIKNFIKEKDTAIEVKNISFMKKIKDISFRVKKGEMLGIGGLSGQGQEEIIMLLAGALKPNMGKFFISGKEIEIKNINSAIKLGIFLVPGDKQRDGLFMDHSVFSNSIIPRFSLKKDRFVLNFKNLNKIVDKIINWVSLMPPKKNTLIKNLSGGNQQKVVFGRWLQFAPRVLLLNDPAKGIDIQAKNDIYEIVKKLSDKGTAVILYASCNEELIKNCDRVLIIYEGRIVKELLREEITDDNLINYSLRGE